MFPGSFGLGLRVSGLGFRVKGLGFWVLGYSLVEGYGVLGFFGAGLLGL